MKKWNMWNVRVTVTGILLGVLLSIGILSSPASAAVNDPEVVWSKYYPNIHVFNTQIREQSGIISLVGYNSLYSTPYTRKQEFYLARINMQGNIIWSRLFSPDKYSNFSFGDAIVSRDGGFILRGSFQDQNGLRSFYIAKLDKNGIVMWETILNKEDSSQEVPFMIETNDYGIVLALRSYNGSEYTTTKLIKYNSDGVKEWDYLAVSSSPSGALLQEDGTLYSILEDAEGNYYVIGAEEAEKKEATIWKLNSSRQIIWKKKSNQIRPSMALASDGGVVIQHYVNSDSFNLLKLDKNGQEEWDKNIGTGYCRSIQPVYGAGYVFACNEGVYITKANGELKSYTPLESRNVDSKAVNHGIILISNINYFEPTNDFSLKLTYLSTEGENPPGQPNAATESIAFSDEEYSISVGKTLSTQILAKKEGKDYNVTQNAEITSDDPSIVSVDKAGEFTGIKKGTTTLTATYGGKTTSVKVTVY
nr:Ig-like domain-containing protein [Paenibacillus shirakamiensis]